MNEYGRITIQTDFNSENDIFVLGSDGRPSLDGKRITNLALVVVAISYECPEALRMAQDIITGSGGIVSSVRRDAMKGLRDLLEVER